MTNYINNIDGFKAFAASGVAAIAGETSILLNTFVLPDNIELVNTLFQHAAWTVAILAGIVSIVNGVRKWIHNDKKNT